MKYLYTLRNISGLFLGVILFFSSLQNASAATWKTGWDIMLPIRNPVGEQSRRDFPDSAYILAYDKKTGLGSILRITNGETLKEFKWTRNWTNIGHYHHGFIFHKRNSGLAKFYKIEVTKSGEVGFDIVHVKTYDKLRKTWDVVMPYNYKAKNILGIRNRSQSAVLFYSRADGRGVINEYTRKYELGKKIYAANGWRKSWNIIELSAGKSIIFYDRSAGVGSIYELSEYGTLGRKLLDSSQWRKTWHSIVPYSGTQKTFSTQYNSFTLFYDNTRGEASIYSTTEEGKLDKLIKTYSGWRKTWDIIVPYPGQTHKPTQNFLFYDKETGAVNTYEINTDGTLGKRLQK